MDSQVHFFKCNMEVLAIAKQNNEVQINEQITFQNVMVIGPNGEKMGVKNINDALTLSKYAGLDFSSLHLLFQSDGTRSYFNACIFIKDA